MHKPLYKLILGAAAASWTFGSLGLNVFAAESTETIDAALENVEADFSSASLTLTPGQTDQAEIPILSYTVEQLDIPEGLGQGGPLVESNTDAQGNEVTVTTGALYDESGKCIGYSVLSEKSEESDSIVSEDGKSADITVTTTQTEQSWYVVEGEDGLYYLVSGSMSDVSAEKDNGMAETESIKPTMFEEYLAGLNAEEYNEEVMLAYWPKPEADPLTEEDFEEYSYRYVDTTALSALKANTTDGGEVGIFMFEMEDAKGNRHYAYCANKGVTAVRFSGYNLINVEDAEYLSADAAAHIKAIALAGYWGTEEGVGSLDSVKQFLKTEAKLAQSIVDKLTPGMAMTATQVALWYYATSPDAVEINYSKPANVYNVNPFYNWAGGPFNAQKLTTLPQIAVNALISKLIALDPAKVEDNATTLITENNFAVQATVDVKGQKENGWFLTDISFLLDMTPSSEDDLVVIVGSQEGEVLGAYRIAGALKEGESLADAAQTASGMAYTLSNICIAEGMNIVLNLKGTQKLEEGVYFYTADSYLDSQTFVGIAKGTRNVDLCVALAFGVKEPSVQIQHDTLETVSTSVKTIEIEEVEEDEEREDDVLEKDPDQTVTDEIEEEKKEDTEEETAEENEENKEEEEKKETSPSESLVQTAAASHRTMVMAAASSAMFAGLLVSRRKR